VAGDDEEMQRFVPIEDLAVGLSLHQSPVQPDQQCDPEDSIQPAQPRPRVFSSEHSQLLPKGSGF
jgi:hypothetical protein